MLKIFRDCFTVWTSAFSDREKGTGEDREEGAGEKEREKEVGRCWEEHKVSFCAVEERLEKRRRGSNRVGKTQS